MLWWLTAAALACGADDRISIVGWSDDGGVLVRSEHEGDDGTPHARSLSLRGTPRAKTWTILTPEDEGDPNVRGSRWKAAEAELADLRVTLTPDRAPAASGHVRSVPLPDGTELRLQGYSYHDSTMHRSQLSATRGDASRFLQVLVDRPNSGAFAITEAHVSPDGQTVALVSNGLGPDVTLVTMDRIDAAFAKPLDPCRGTDKVVGWGPDGHALVHSEAVRTA